MTTSWKLMEQLILETRGGEKKIIIRSSHGGFCKGKSYLANLISFYSEMTNLMDEEGAVDIVFLTSVRFFDTDPVRSS